MSAAEKLPAGQPGVIYVRHDQLTPSPLNPRKHARTDAEIAELAASIASKGLLQNLVVRNDINKLGDDEQQTYEIAAGEGRWRAVGKLIADGNADGSYLMPVAVRELSDTDMIEIGLIENLQRNDLEPLDEARAFAALYDAHAKILGRKAAAHAVEKIAGKISRSTRYVQKRIKLARDLLPGWAELLDQGVLQLQTALALSGMPAKAQQKELDDCREYRTNEIDRDRVRDLSPHRMADDWRPMTGALFDVAKYTGDVVDVDGEAHATDVKQFDALQKVAAAAFVKDMRAKTKAGEILFFDEVQNFEPQNYEQGEDGDTGGVVLHKNYDGEFRVYRNLIKTKALIEREEKQKAAQLATAKRAKREREETKPKKKAAAPQWDPRINEVRTLVAADKRAQYALAIFTSELGRSTSDGLGWVRHRAWDRTALERAIAEAGGAKKKGDKLLAWLLEQKTATLADILLTGEVGRLEVVDREAPDVDPKSDKVLFDYAGATGATKADAPAKGKARTASKSKPSKKKGKGK